MSRLTYSVLSRMERLTGRRRCRMRTAAAGSSNHSMGWSLVLPVGSRLLVWIFIGFSLVVEIAHLGSGGAGIGGGGGSNGGAGGPGKVRQPVTNRSNSISAKP